MAYRPAQVYTGSGWDDVGDKRIGAANGDIPQASVANLTSDLASKLPYSYGTATPTTSTDGFLWYDENDTPPTPKFWDGAAFQALTSGKILQVVRATDSTLRSTTSTTATDVTGMTVTITPQKSTSAIIVISSFIASVSNTTVNGNFLITDNSNNALSGAERAVVAIDVNVAPIVLIGYSTPATTSAVTYKLRFYSKNSGTTQIFNADQTGQIYALEIGA